MGDLSFSLTLKSRIEEETKKITKELNKIDATGKQAQNALEAISEATKGIGDKGGRGFEKLNNFVKELRRNIAVFSSEDFFSPKKLQQLESVQNGLYKIGSILGEVSKKGAGFNIFPNSVATEANKAKRELYKLSSFISEINKRHGEGIQIFGVDSTNSIRQSLSELSKYRTELEQIRNNGGIHPITGLTASDVVKSAGFLNAKDEAKAYAKEIKQALKEADAAKKASIEAEKKNEQIVENILQRRAQERQRVAEKEAEIERQRQEQAKISAQIAQENANSEIKWNEQKAKAFSEALQRQMKASVEAEKKNEQIVENILQRRAQERQRVAEKEAEIERQRQEQAKISAQIAQENANSEIKWNEQKAKAFSEALQRQMKASVEAEKKRQVSLFSNGFDTTILEKRIAMLNRMKEIQDKLAYYHPKAQYAFLDYESGLKFGNANTSEMRHKEDELQRLRNIIADLESEFNKLGGNEAFKNVDNQIKNLEQTIARLKESGGSLNLGKMLGLENKSTDEFRIAKEAAMATEAHVKRQNELTAAFEKYFNVQKQVEDAEKRLAEATARTNQARREAIAASRQQAESLVRDRVKELEAQRQQLQGLFGSGKNVLSTQELIQLQQAFSQITQELNTLRSAMNNLGSYSIKDLFSIGRGTSEYTPLINSMRTVIDQKQEAINLERKHQEEITRTAAKARNDLAAAFAGVNAEAKKMQSIVGDIKSLFLQGGIVFGAQQFFNSIVQTGGEIVQQHVALRSILGDVQKADELFAQTQQLALQSPFKFGELNRDVKQLAAFGVEANELYDTTKRLADIASGLGVDFGRLGLAFGQVKARSWLDGKELRQFAYAGLPLLQKITELYNSEGKNGRKNYTQADVKKMISGRQVSFEDVQKVLWKMTDEGGQFYNMQLVLSETLLGRWNKLIDAWDIMLGKFAEGKNIIGGTFSFIINRVTDLVLALDKLSPAMLSFGAIFAARKIGLMASGKLGFGSINKNYTQQMNAQLRTYAIEQQQLVTEGKITQQKALQNVQARAYLLSDTTSRANAMSRLALEGKMSVLQMQKAVKEGLVTKELIRQLAVMGQITARQEQIILGGTRFAAVMNMGISKIGGGIKSLFTMLGGWWGLAIGAAVQIFSSYSSDMDRISENAKGFRDSAYNKKKSYEDELANEKPVNSADLQQRVNSMKELLRNSGDYTQTIEDQIARAKNLNEQYDILNKGIVAARDNSQQEANDSDVIAGALGASGGWGSGNPFADTIEDAVEDLNEAVVKYQTLLSGLDEETKSRMDSVANQFLKPEERAMSLDEKVRILAERGGANWDSFVLKSSNGSNDIANSIYKIGIRANKVSDQINDIAKKNIPRIISFLKNSFNLFGADFSKWCNRNSTRFASMIERMLDACKVNVPQIREYLKSIFYQEAGVKLPKKAGGGKTVKPKTPMQQRVRRNLSKKGKSKTKVESQAVMLDSYLDETSDYNTDNNLQTELQNRYNEYKNRENKFKRGKISKALRDEAWESYNSLNQAAWEGLGYKFYPQDKKSNKVPKGKKNTHVNQEDKELETLRKRIDLYKKFYSELEKYRKIYGDEGAMIQMRNDKEFKNSVLSWKLSDPGTYGSSIRELMNRLPSSTQKRREYKESQQADIHAKNRSIEEERIRETNNMLSKRLNIISEQYKTYKKIYELTGNSKGASMLAFGYVQSGTYQDYLKEQMKWAVKEHNERTGQSLSADDVLKMNESDFNKHIGSESENASVIYKEWVEETARIKQETIDLLANLVEKNATIDQQIEDENRKYERQLELIKGIKDAGMRDRATEGAEKTHNENLAKLEFEKFKQESDWVTIFDDLDRVSSSTINSMIEKIDGFSKTTGLSVEVVKQLRDALGKLRDEQIDRNPINGIVGGMQRGNAIGSFIGSRFRKGMDISTTTYVDSSDAKKMGIKEGNHTKGQLENEKKGAYEDANKGVSKLADKFKALQDCLTPVISLFEVLGEEDSFLGQATNMASGAFGAAVQVSGGLNALGLGSLGPYGAAAGAALSVVTSLFAMHDKALQKEIEASEERQKELDNMTKNVKSIIEDALGGIYSYKERSDTKSTISKITSNYELADAWKKTGIGKSLPFLVKSVYSKETYEAAKEAQSKPGSAYHAELASLKAQKDELQSQRNSENEKKKKDNSKIADYDQQIKEMELQIDSFAKDFLKDIYSIDFKSWASELTDAVVGAWEKGEDAVEAYKEKVKDMVKDVTKNIVTQKIMEAALQKPLGYLTNILKDKGKLDETDMNQLADLLYKAGDEVVPQITGIFEALKKRGLDLMDNGSSSSTKNSIKSITEETADILASYLNAVRLDVSVIREMQGKFIPEMSEIAKSQLTQLNLIAQNTLRNADAAERIDKTVSELNDNFNRVINGTKSLKMK